MTCGVCGGDLSDVPFESEERIQQEQDTDVRREELVERAAIRKIERRRIATTISEFVGGVVCLILGFIIVGQFKSFYGLPVLLLGMGLIAHSIADRRYRMRGPSMTARMR